MRSWNRADDWIWHGPALRVQVYDGCVVFQNNGGGQVRRRLGLLPVPVPQDKDGSPGRREGGDADWDSADDCWHTSTFSGPANGGCCSRSAAELRTTVHLYL